MAKFGIDESLIFRPVRIAILTVSDTRTQANDTSGDILIERLEMAGHELADRKILKDDKNLIQDQVKDWTAREDIHVIVSTGGTGLTGRDVTVEAMRPLFDKEIDGFSVVFHMVSFGTVGLSTLQSRACAGLIRETFVFCLPGSNGAAKDGWDKVIRDQLDSRHRPCNFVDLMPRLNER